MSFNKEKEFTKETTEFNERDDLGLVSGSSKWDKYLTSIKGEKVTSYDNNSTYGREKRELERDDDSSPERYYKKISI